MRKKLLLLIILIIPIITGCNYKELNNLSIINMMSIDLKDNNYEVSVHVLNTDKSLENQSEAFSGITYKAVGNNLTEAISNISLSIPKKIYLNHLELLVISETIANERLNDIINYFINNNDVSKNFSVLLSRNVDAHKILESKELMASYPYGDILGSIENSSSVSGISSDIKFLDLATLTNTSYKTPVISTIKLDDKKLKIDDLAIFKDDKIVDYLDNKYNLAYNFISDSINEAILNFKCDDNNYSGVKVTNSNTIIRPIIRNNNPFIKIYITGDVYLTEDGCKNRYDVTKEASDELKNIVSNVLDYSIDNDVDIFNIETLFYKYKSKYYKKNDFKKIYKNLDYEIVTKLVRR